ncbi:Lysophospholipid acyltransferase [Nosema granulosis]|uniref:Lysophospholipid acyltransferase n=1 Tax=Nosema granulosis TaxID=83296 RepID=A0A9P6L0P9_9MICR|nr:Lysophospholipid acyltransferase [Nosema granulosis]
MNFRINLEDIRFISGVLLTLLLSKHCKLRKGLFPLLCSAAIVYITFDLRLALYVFTSYAFNILLLFTFRFNEYVFTVINFAILYIFKIKGKSIDPNIGGTYDVSGILMLTTIKMCYLGRDFDRKKHSLLEVIGYLTFIPGLIMGPTPTFKQYQEREEKDPGNISWTLLGRSLIFLLTFKLVFDNYFPISLLYKNDVGILHQLFNLYGFNLGQRLRFYFAWNFTEACYALQGFDDMKNIDFFKVEFATSIKDLSQGWNIKTNVWLKECFFEKLKHKSVFFASLMTFLVSALWHGINAGYANMFLSFGISIPIVRSVNKFIMTYMGVAFPVLSRIQMVFFIMYFSSPFFILDLKKTFITWKNVYFYGHFYCFICCALFLLPKMFKN